MFVFEQGHKINPGVELEVTLASKEYDLNGSTYILQNSGTGIIYLNTVGVPATATDFALAVGASINLVSGGKLNYLGATASKLKVIRTEAI